MIKIAIQKSGRLFEDTFKLLQKCGIDISNSQKKLKVKAQNFPIEVLFVRDDDIPQYVHDGVANIGVVGENVLYETKLNLPIIRKLNFGKCRLSLAVQKDMPFSTIADVKNLRVATSYPNLVKDFSEQNGLNLDIHVISGSVELAPSIGLANAIVDLVSTGSTLAQNGLKEVATILKSESVLISNNELNDEQNEILNQLLLRLDSVLRAQKNKYIMLNAPNHKLDEICKILPGIKAPTVVALATEGWSSVQSVVNEDNFWMVINQLKNCQAEGILVLPIEQMID